MCLILMSVTCAISFHKKYDLGNEINFTNVDNIVMNINV